MSFKTISKSVFKGLLYWFGASFCLLFTIGVWDEYKNLELNRVIASPVSDYVVYANIVAEKNVFMIGESLWFKSFSQVKKVVGLEYEDILRCRPESGGAFSYYSVARTSVTVSSISNYLKDGKLWRYGAELPYYQTSCILDSNISVVIHVDGETIRKNISHRSKPFDFVISEEDGG